MSTFCSVVVTVLVSVIKLVLVTVLLPPTRPKTLVRIKTTASAITQTLATLPTINGVLLFFLGVAGEVDAFDC